MEKAKVVTDSYIAALEGKKVLEAIFTTYTIDINFFETEVLWILTGTDMNKFSPNADVRKRELAHYYQKNKLPITLYFDRKVNNWDADEIEQAISPLIEYLLVPINSGNSAFHPKVTLLLVEDMKTAEKSILFINGSNNLTYPGWWENIECINIELLDKETGTKSLLNECIKTIEYLSKKRKEVYEELLPFTSYLEVINQNYKLKDTKDHYFSSYNKEKFKDFILNHIKAEDYNILEVISPYFAESEDTVIELLSSINPMQGEIKLFLPRNEDDELLCNELLFDKINASKNIIWSTFQSYLADELQIKTVIKAEDEEHSSIRKVHAKIFHWYNTNSKKSIYFIGSVNLSYKAFSENYESGKLIFIENGKELLIETKEDSPKYADDTDIFDEVSDNEIYEENIFINLSLVYDWKTKQLTVNNSLGKNNLTLFTLLLSEQQITLQHNIIFSKNNELEATLNSEPFVNVKYKEKIKKIFVNQQNFTHKPLDLGNLSVKEILDIYAKFGFSQKDNDLIQKAIQRALYAKGIESDIDLLEDSVIQKNFFSEYSEIFYGLRHLKELLLKDPDREDYFLDESTKAMDSIPVLIEETLKDVDMDVVSKYITLLYVKQVYMELNRSLEFIDNFIKKLKKDYKKEFKEHQKFVKWFESAFFMEFTKAKL